MASQPHDCTCPTQDIATLARLGAEAKLPPCPRHNPGEPAQHAGLNSPELLDQLTGALERKDARNARFAAFGDIPGGRYRF